MQGGQVISGIHYTTIEKIMPTLFLSWYHTKDEQTYCSIYTQSQDIKNYILYDPMWGIIIIYIVFEL